MMSKPFLVIILFIFTSIFIGNFLRSEFCLGQKKFGSGIFLGKKIWVKKNVGRKFFGVKKIWVGNLLGQKKFGSEIFLVKKKLGRNFFWSNKIWVGNFFGLKKIWVGNLFFPNSTLVLYPRSD